MAQLTREEEQKQELSKIIKKLTKVCSINSSMHSDINRCTSEDLKYIIRLLKHDLRTNSGPKYM